MSPEELWASKYAARFAEEKLKEDALREQAFLDLSAILCGEELRVMTPMDLFTLNGVGSPFVCAGEPTAGDVALFLWFLNVKNDGTNSWWNERRKMQTLRRISSLPFDETVRAIYAHVADIFHDAPAGGGDSKPLGTCFLVPLMLRVSKATHWGKAEILGTPLPQLFQILKAVRAEAEGADFVDIDVADRIKAEFLDELHARNQQPAHINGAN